MAHNVFICITLLFCVGAFTVWSMLLSAYVVLHELAATFNRDMKALLREGMYANTLR